jgi:signal transduction histidine kinase
MIKKLMQIQLHYVFITLAIIILIGATITSTLFYKTQDEIIEINKSAYINYIDNLSDNISDTIKQSPTKDIHKFLKKNKIVRDTLETGLQLLVTNRYRYVYVVDKVSEESQKFRFLLDGAKDSKLKRDFEDFYTPNHIEEWNSVYKSKKSMHFKHSDASGDWITYLKPIIIDGETKAMIAIEFSLQGHDLIVSSLNKLNNFLTIANVFILFIFFAIVLFSIIDYKRVQELLSFNEKLESKVKEELLKNRQKDQHMIQQSRLAQMGEMISMIAHQWRQPLAAISIASGSIKFKASRDKLTQESAIELSNKITSYSQDLSETIENFSEFFKLNKEKEREETSYNELLESVLSIIGTSLDNRNISVVKNFNSQEKFYTYPSELKQVILNLIKNAEEILLETEVKEPTITLTTEKNSLKISDNAGGVSEKIIDKIFDPYFSTKEEKNGKGLGLYMSKTIIEEHCEGSLSVSNDKNGAVFTIILKS